MIKKKKVIYLLACLLTIQQVYAQNVETYDGLLAVNDVNYQAEFDYYLSRGDTVYHGPYSLINFTEEDPETNTFDYSSIKGTFKQNQPDGEWTIRQGKFTPTGGPEFKDYSYGYNINGKEFIAQGKFENGVKNSTWTIYEWELENSKPEDTLLAAHLPFRNNSIEGDFSILYNGQILEGSIDREQFTDKKWSFYEVSGEGEKQLLKEWVFKENQLVQKVLYNSNDNILTIDITTSPRSKPILEEINLTGNYLEIIDLNASKEDISNLKKYDDQKRIRDLFFMVIDNLQEIDSSFLPVANIQLAPHIKTKIEKYPFNDREKVLLEDITNNTREANQLIEKIQNDPQINLGSISTPEVAFYTAVINVIEEEFLHNHSIIANNYRSGDLEYVNRNNLFEKIINTNKAVEIPAVIDGQKSVRTYQLEYLNVDSGKEPIEQMAALSKGILTEVKVLNDSLAIYVEEIKKEENLSQVEGDLIKKHQRVKNLNDSLLDARHQLQAGFRVKSLIDNFADSTLKEYSNLSSTQEKSESVAGFIQCFDHMEALIYAIQDSPENAEVVRNAYTNNVFNPYTFTDMEEIVKEPIYRAFENVLLPGIYRNLNQLDCGNIEGYTRNFETIFEAMIILLDQNTRRDERRVKKTNSPSRISEILNLELKF